MNSSAATLLLNTPSSSLITTLKTGLVTSKPFFYPRPNKSTPCKASKQSSPVIDHGFNLYELLGIDASSDKAQIKEAYRSLQKRCHPDIAGPAGHDMAIVLNETYALLSDPVSRMEYDKELAKVSDLQGFTGKPIYSVWLGSESERRAVFVDEVKCVGCLKCALFAEKTFAIESVYGRARVVAQWADPEDKIQDAIGTCPVDCISIVERSDLAALEFIMTKQPRGKVRIGAGNTAGERSFDIFSEMEKFQAKYAKQKASTEFSNETESYRASRISAIQAIQMITNWIYWQTPVTNSAPLATISPNAKRRSEPSFKRLKDAAEAIKQGRPTTQASKVSANTEEYWAPLALELPEPTTPVYSSKGSTKPKESRKMRQENTLESMRRKEKPLSPLRLGVPIGTGVLAACIVGSHVGESAGGVKEHFGGSLALAMVNSSEMQIVLAGFTWYIIGTYVVELVEALRRK